MSTPALDGAAVQQIASLAQAASTAPRFQIPSLPTQVPVLIWQDKTITDIEHLLAKPCNKRGVAALGDHVAFADYVNAHRTDGLVIFGDVNEHGGGFVAILDGHIAAVIATERQGDVTCTQIKDAGAPQWGEHRATLDLKPTPEWARWIGANGKSMPQEAFAIFLEENAADVVVPPEDVKTIAGFPVPHGQLPNAAELMSVALTLQTKTDVEFSSKINRHNGQTQVTYLEKMTSTHAGAAEGKMGIPEFFTIAVAPFRGGAAQFILCRLRFRAAGGKAIFEYQLLRPHKTVEHAWKLVAADIAAATGENVLLGHISIPGRAQKPTITSTATDDRNRSVALQRDAGLNRDRDLGINR